jgi:UDP-3-O-[3-hydroxymyristoyl] glucosamine N-acyltransferase
MKVPGSSVTGSPAFDYTAALRSQAAARKLPELEKRVRELEELVKEMLAKTVQV